MGLIIALLFVGSNIVFTQESGPLTEEDGADFELALGSLYRNISESNNQSAGLNSNRPIVLMQRALNGYLRFQGASMLPEGLSDVTVEIHEGGRLTGTGTLNLDEIDDFDTGTTGMLQFLSGSLPVSLTALIGEADGELHVTLEHAQIGPVSLPPALAQLLVRRYSASDSHPRGIDLTNAILIPSAVEDIQIQQGQITVVTK